MVEDDMETQASELSAVAGRRRRRKSDDVEKKSKKQGKLQ